jgi:hypothetical protein
LASQLGSLYYIDDNQSLPLEPAPVGKVQTIDASAVFLWSENHNETIQTKNLKGCEEWLTDPAEVHNQQANKKVKKANDNQGGSMLE